MHYVARNNLLAPHGKGRLGLAGRRIPAGAPIPEGLWTEDQIKEMIRTGAVGVEYAPTAQLPAERPPQAAPRPDEDLGTVESATQDGYSEPARIETVAPVIDPKLRELMEREEKRPQVTELPPAAQDTPAAAEAIVARPERPARDVGDVPFEDEVPSED